MSASSMICLLKSERPGGNRVLEKNRYYENQVFRCLWSLRITFESHYDHWKIEVIVFQPGAFIKICYKN